VSRGLIKQTSMCMRAARALSDLLGAYGGFETGGTRVCTGTVGAHTGHMRALNKVWSSYFAFTIHLVYIEAVLADSKQIGPDGPRMAQKRTALACLVLVCMLVSAQAWNPFGECRLSWRHWPGCSVGGGAIIGRSRHQRSISARHSCCVTAP